MSTSTYQLFSEINDFTHATLDGYQVDRIVFDAVGKTITVHCPTFYVELRDQMAVESQVNRGLRVLSADDSQAWALDLYNGPIDHGAFERPEWDKLPLDTIVFEGQVVEEPPRKLWLFDMIDEHNTICFDEKNQLYISRLWFDPVMEVVKMNFKGESWLFNNQVCQYADDEVTFIIRGTRVASREFVSHHLLFIHQELNENRKFVLHDARNQTVIKKINPKAPAAPFVYRLEDAEGFRRLMRYLRDPGDGNPQRTFIDSASLDDDDGLRRLLQLTRDHAAQDGGEGYYDTEMIWLQKGSQYGSTDGPAIPPVPSRIDTSKMPTYRQSEFIRDLSEKANVTTFDRLYQLILDHCNLATAEAMAAEQLLDRLRQARKAIVELEKVEKSAADAAFEHMVPVISELMDSTLKLTLK